MGFVFALWAWLAHLALPVFAATWFFSGASAPSYSLTKSWRMDGSNQYISVADEAALDITDNFSVEIIGFFPPLEGSHWNFFNKRASGTDRAWDIYILTNDSGKVTFNVLEDGNGSPTKSYLSAAAVDDGALHQLGMTFASGTFKVYIDGVDVTAGATKSVDDTVASIHTNAAAIQIGAADSATFPLLAKVGRAVIWDTAVLAANEYAELWNSGVPTDPNSNHGNYSSSGDVVASWLMESDDATGADGVVDSSGAGIHGTTVNLASTDLVALSAESFSVQFDGADNWVALSNAALNGITDHFSIVTWAKVTTDGANACFFGAYNGESNGRNFNILRLSDNTWRYLASADGTNVDINYTTDTAITDKAWHHYVVTYDGSASPRTKMYFDGVLESSFAIETDGGGGAMKGQTMIDPMFLGASKHPEDVGSQWVPGNMLYPAIFSGGSGVLSQSEITTLYNSGVALNPSTISPSVTSLKYLWHFSTGDDLTSTDGVVEQVTGTIDGTGFTVSAAKPILTFDVP